MIPRFRFYSKRMKKMGTVISLKPFRNRVYVEWNDNLSGTENIDDNGILMQSTGLFDKKGTEIFEGDIVRSCGYDYCEGRVYRTTEFIGVIVYHKNSFCIQFGDFLGSWWANDEEIEVLGNIYQNSDLLESVEVE